MRKITMLALAALCSISALATENNTIFSCTADNGMPIEVKKMGNDYQFTYSQISFKNAIKNVFHNEKSFVAAGSGFITNSLELNDKGKSYTIEFVQPRNAPKMIDEPTLYIEKGDDMQTIKCDTNKPVLQHFNVKAMRSGF